MLILFKASMIMHDSGRRLEVSSEFFFFFNCCVGLKLGSILRFPEQRLIIKPSLNEIAKNIVRIISQRAASVS